MSKIRIFLFILNSAWHAWDEKVNPQEDWTWDNTLKYKTRKGQFDVQEEEEVIAHWKQDSFPYPDYILINYILIMEKI